jgi:hypothetical protein
VWLAEVDEELGLCARRSPSMSPNGAVPRYDTPSLYAGASKGLSDSLRLRGPERFADAKERSALLKLVCGRLPQTDADLASQPTISRLENAADARSCYRIGGALCVGAVAVHLGGPARNARVEGEGEGPRRQRPARRSHVERAWLPLWGRREHPVEVL